MRKNIELCQKSSIAFALMIAIFYVLSIIGQALLNAITNPGSVLFVAVASTFSMIAMICSWLLISKAYEVKPIEIISLKKFKPIYLVPTILLAVGMFFGLGFVNGLIAELIEGVGGSVGDSNIPLNNIGQYILFSIMFAVMPAVFEEIFFRGVMLYGLKNLKNSLAIILTALCFALYHGSLTQLVYQFIYGIILAVLVVKTKSILPGIIIHFLNNFAVLTISCFNLPVNVYNPILIIIGIISLILGSVFLLVYDKRQKSTSSESVFNFFFPYGLFIMLVCFIMAVLSAVNL